jgi:hypothetical protein
VQNYFAGVATLAVSALTAVVSAAGAGATFVVSTPAGAASFLAVQDTHATAATTANNNTNFFIFFYLLELNIYDLLVLKPMQRYN